MEETIAALLSQSRQVAEENDHLKTVLCSVMQENRELRGRMYNFTNDTDELRGGVVLPRDR